MLMFETTSFQLIVYC